MASVGTVAWDNNISIFIILTADLSVCLFADVPT